MRVAICDRIGAPVLFRGLLGSVGTGACSTPGDRPASIILMAVCTTLRRALGHPGPRQLVTKVGQPRTWALGWPLDCDMARAHQVRAFLSESCGEVLRARSARHKLVPISLAKTTLYEDLAQRYARLEGPSIFADARRQLTFWLSRRSRHTMRDTAHA